jgi:hypothetical protein
MWEALIPIIAQEGIPVAEALFQKWASGKDPTQADFDELRSLGNQHAIDRIKAKLVARGIPLDSDQAKQLIALAS